MEEEKTLSEWIERIAGPVELIGKIFKVISGLAASAGILWILTYSTLVAHTFPELRVDDLAQVVVTALGFAFLVVVLLLLLAPGFMVRFLDNEKEATRKMAPALFLALSLAAIVILGLGFFTKIPIWLFLVLALLVPPGLSSGLLLRAKPPKTVWIKVLGATIPWSVILPWLVYIVVITDGPPNKISVFGYCAVVFISTGFANFVVTKTRPKYLIFPPIMLGAMILVVSPIFIASVPFRVLHIGNVQEQLALSKKFLEESHLENVCPTAAVNARKGGTYSFLVLDSLGSDLIAQCELNKVTGELMIVRIPKDAIIARYFSYPGKAPTPSPSVSPGRP